MRPEPQGRLEPGEREAALHHVQRDAVRDGVRRQMGQLGPPASGTEGMDDGSRVKRTVEPFTSPRVQTSPAERAKRAALRFAGLGGPARR